MCKLKIWLIDFSTGLLCLALLSTASLLLFPTIKLTAPILAIMHFNVSSAVWFLITQALITVGILYFVLDRQRHIHSLSVFLKGAYFGLTSCGVMAFGNAYLIRHWPLALSLLLILTGMLCCGITSLVIHSNRCARC